MTLLNQSRFGIKYLTQLVAFVRYGTREGISLLFAIAFGGSGYWLLTTDNKVLEPVNDFQIPVAIGLFVVAASLFCYVLYRLIFRLAIPKPGNDQPLPSAIKGLMPFIAEDGELFRHLERESELAKLKDYLNNPQIGLVVVMGESGAGKTSLLRAGLSHLLQGKDCRYVHWEARPTEAMAGLLKSIKQGLGVEVADLNTVLTLTKPAVIVLDQFEQLLPDKAEFAAIFNLLKTVANAAPPHNLTWIVAFRREYLPYWRDFELDNQLKQCETLSLKLFSVPQAQNVMATLAESAGLSLEQPLLAGFIDTVKREERLSPVDIGIGLLMLQELAMQRRKQELSLADYQFAGGSQGLFVLFLKSKIEYRFDDKREQEALFKVLLALVDLKRNQRVAEGRLFAELAEQAQDLDERLLAYELDHLASGKVRLLEKIIRANGKVAYRLPHEIMIPALRQLGNSLLDAVTQANFTLQTAFQAWQNSARKDSRYLLDGKELKQVLQFKEQLDLQNKGEFLNKSVKKRKRQQAIASVLVLALAGSAYVGHGYWEEWNYSKYLRNFDMPENLRDYSHQLKVLTINPRGVINLKLFETFTELTSLDLQLNNLKIEDINELENIKHLASLNLDLSGSQLNDLNFLKNLKLLTTIKLNLSNSQFEDLGALENIKNINSIDIDLSKSDYVLTYLDTIKNLSLVNLHLSYSQFMYINNQTKLESLSITKLTLINLEYPPISTEDGLKPLKALKNLSHLSLDLSYSSTGNLNALKELKKLNSLNITLVYSATPDLSILKELKDLKSLSLSLGFSSIDLSSLKEIKNLNSLDLSLGAGSSIITDIIELKELKSLTSLGLDLDYSSITDLDVLRELKNLKELTLSINRSNIDLSVLKELTWLTSLDLNLGQASIKDLVILKELKNITSLSLNLTHSKITDLSTLKELKNITSLDLKLSLSKITDLSALKELKNLTSLSLDLRGSQITDLYLLDGVLAKEIKLRINKEKFKSLKGMPFNVTELVIE